MKKFEVISVSESEVNAFFSGEPGHSEIPNEEYFGVLPGLMHGWEFEFVNKAGETGYNSVYWFYGTPEECAYRWGEAEAFWCERLNGWEPTGRVVFRGYGAEGEWIPEEREYSVREATKWEIQEAINYVLEAEREIEAATPGKYEEYEEYGLKWA